MANQEKRVKTAGINVRVKPEIKRLADSMASAENRTMTNLFETMILERAEKIGLKPNQDRE